MTTPATSIRCRRTTTGPTRAQGPDPDYWFVVAPARGALLGAIYWWLVLATLAVTVLVSGTSNVGEIGPGLLIVIVFGTPVATIVGLGVGLLVAMICVALDTCDQGRRSRSTIAAIAVAVTASVTTLWLWRTADSRPVTPLGQLVFWALVVAGPAALGLVSMRIRPLPDPTQPRTRRWPQIRSV